MVATSVGVVPAASLTTGSADATAGVSQATEVELAGVSIVAAGASGTAASPAATAGTGNSAATSPVTSPATRCAACTSGCGAGDAISGGVSDPEEASEGTAEELEGATTAGGDWLELVEGDSTVASEAAGEGVTVSIAVEVLDGEDSGTEVGVGIAGASLGRLAVTTGFRGTATGVASGEVGAGEGEDLSSTEDGGCVSLGAGLPAAGSETDAVSVPGLGCTGDGEVDTVAVTVSIGCVAGGSICTGSACVTVASTTGVDGDSTVGETGDGEAVAAETTSGILATFFESILDQLREAFFNIIACPKFPPAVHGQNAVDDIIHLVHSQYRATTTLPADHPKDYSH